MTPDALELERRVQRLEQDLARVDQRAADARDELRAAADVVKHIPPDLAVIKERVGLAIKKANDALSKQEELEDFLRQRERDQLRERKSDRRWLIGTALSSAGLVIAALAVLVDKL